MTKPETPESGREPEVPKPSILRLFKNAGLYGFGQTVAWIIDLVTSPILSYLLTRADFGLLGLTRSISGMLTSFYTLGLDGAANRFHFDAERDKPQLRRIVGTLNTFLLGWIVLLSLLQEVFGPRIYASLFPGVPYEVFGRFVAFGLACDGLMAIPRALWGARENVRRIVVLRLLTSLLSTAVVLTLLLGPKLGVMSLFWAGVVGPLLTLHVYLRFAYSTFGFAWDVAILKRALVFGLPMVVHLTSHWALDAGDRIMLDRLLDREAVGLYTVAYGSVGALFGINMSINGAYVPQFMRAQPIPEQVPFVAKMVTYFLMSTGGATFVFVLFGSTTIRAFYSERFVAAASLTPLLSLAPFFHSVYLIYVNGLFQAKRTLFIPLYTLLAAFTNLGLNALWIPRMGIRGAAWATLLSYVVLAMLVRIGCGSATRIPLERERLLRLLGPLAIMTTFAYLVDGRYRLSIEFPIKLGLLLMLPVALHFSGFIQQEERVWIRARIAKWRRALG